MVGQRWDLDFDEALDFGPGWEAKFRVKVITEGQVNASGGIDYFVFPKKMLGRIPPFAIGRTAWDNWLIYRACTLKVPVINASKAVMAVHQNHDYAHISTKSGDIWKGPEAKRNLELAGGNCFTFRDSTHELTSAGLKLAFGLGYFERRVAITLIRYPCLTKFSRPIKEIVRTPRNIKSIFKKLLSQGGKNR